jgi:thiamine pyrophosphate-dependent acetolactate synthase large subunit-like protein
MSAAREVPRLSQHPLDLHFVPSTMGGGPPLGLGLALAQPQRQVLVLTGDGSLLMNLGALVTVASSGAANLTIAVLDNGVYEVTGGQKTAASDVGVDYAGLAQAAGFANVAQFADAGDLERRMARVQQAPGPRFIWLQVEPLTSNYELSSPGPMHERLERFRAALATA